jgi:hypothetical protein
MRWPVALAFVAVTVLGAAAVMLAASTTVTADLVPASDSVMSNDPLADMGEFDAAVPVACSICRSNTVCTSDGQKCNTTAPKSLHCRCSTCDGIITCRPT